MVEGAVARQGDAWAGEFAEVRSPALLAQAAAGRERAGRHMLTALLPQTQRSGAEGRWADSWLREFEGAPRAQADLGQAELGVSGADLAAWVEDFHRAATEAGAPGQLQELQRVWAEQFGGGMAHEDPWAEEFMAAGAGGYRFHPDNPFAGDTQALERGRALFAEGLLSEVGGMRWACALGMPGLHGSLPPHVPRLISRCRPCWPWRPPFSRSRGTRSGGGCWAR